jgi:hypothetical protein
MSFMHWMQRIHLPATRTKSIGCGWGDAGSRQASTSGRCYLF